MTFDRRRFLELGGAATAALLSQSVAKPATKSGPRDFDVTQYGAVGDGTTVDTAALQKAIDAAAVYGVGARVLVPGGKRFLTGGLVLKSGIEFHLADDAQLVANTVPGDYSETRPAILTADRAIGLTISGTGHIDGQAMKFMKSYSPTDERWEPMAFRPRMFSLVSCQDLLIKGISFGHAPQWGLHMLGCERVLVDGITIRNYLDVPNCDGIDPDHCRDLEIRNCDVESADDAIVIKTSDQTVDYGPSRNIVVRDCKVKSRDSGLKIGTETFGDISNVRFERCQVITAGRGPTITHRQPGNIENIAFTDIDVVAEHHAARWWGSGEAISITVWPRALDGKTGSLRDIQIRNIRSRAENSIRVDGSKDNPIRDVQIENVDATLDQWTKYPGGNFDNRPTGPDRQGLEAHAIPVFSIRNAERVTLRDCQAHWGKNIQEYFGSALEAENARDLGLTRFRGEAAHPDRDAAIRVL